MQMSNRLVFSLFSSLAIVLAALHSPGEMSVDSIIALYSALKGVAAGWDQTFFSATLSWLGGGVVGSSLFVALNCIMTYGCFVTLLMRHADALPVPRWQYGMAIVLALNPLFMFYVGIVWKDVMLATVAMLAATLIISAIRQSGFKRLLLLGLAILAIGVLTPIRQQGFLIAAPFAAVAACLMAASYRKQKSPRVIRVGIFFTCILMTAGVTGILQVQSTRTIKPPGQNSMHVGLLVIQSFDIAGMIANAAPGDPSHWSMAPPAVQAKIKSLYDPERIDTFWHDPTIRPYLDALSAKQHWTIWEHGIAHNPMAYVKHRLSAMSMLLGFGCIDGCVPAYWGIYGLPEQVQALGFHEEMDDRAKAIGRLVTDLRSSPVFRNWFYALLLLFASVFGIRRSRGEKRWVVYGIATASWLYLLSFIPTAISCDVRYLYPVASLATLLAVFVLGNTTKHVKNTQVYP